MSDAAAWIMVGGLSLAVSLSLVALIVAVATSRRSGIPGPPGPVGPMGMTGERGEPGTCECQKAQARRSPVRDDATAAPHDMDRRYRAVVRWQDREVIGYGPHQATLRSAERDGQECVDRHGANWYTVEEWADGAWVEVED